MVQNKRPALGTCRPTRPPPDRREGRLQRLPPQSSSASRVTAGAAGKQDPKLLFDEEAIRRDAKEGDMAFNNTDPVLLTIVSKSGLSPSEQQEPQACPVCRGPEEAIKFDSEASRGAGGWTMFELVGVAHRLADALSRTSRVLEGADREQVAVKAFNRPPGIKSNSSHRDNSRLSCDGGRRSLRTRSTDTDIRPETFVVTFAIKI